MQKEGRRLVRRAREGRVNVLSTMVFIPPSQSVLWMLRLRLTGHAAYTQLDGSMLVFRGLVTKDNIWIRVGPNKCGMLLVAQEIQLI